MSRPELEDRYPATPLQEGLLFHALLDPGASAYRLQQSYRIRGPLDVGVLRAACARSIARHAILRTAFEPGADGAWQQCVQREVVAPLETEDWSALDGVAQERQLALRLSQDMERGFDLARAPLFRLRVIRFGPEQHALVKTFHHAITDGWSSALWMRELAALYAAERGAPLSLPPARPFRAYVDWLEGRSLAAAERFFRAELGDGRGPCALQLASGGPGASGPATCEVELVGEPFERLQRWARARRLTPSTLVQGVWALLLARYSGTRDVVFGVAHAGRPVELEGAEQMLGPFLNTLPLRVRVRDGAEPTAWLGELQRRGLDLREHEFAPLQRVLRWAGCDAESALFESLVVFENYARPRAAVPLPSGESLALERRTLRDATHYPLTLYASTSDALRLRFSFDAARFAEPAVRALAESARELLAQLPEPARALSVALARCGRGPREVEGGGPAAGLDGGLLTAIEAAVHRAPAAPALRFRDRVWSYAELWAEVLRLSARLARRGIGAEQRVALLLPRSPEALVALLATWRAGTAAVPLDPASPPERLRGLLRDARPALVLTAGAASAPADPAIPALELSLPQPAGPEPEPRIPAPHGEALAYLMYTSGSSGAPKGVAVSRAALEGFLRAMAARLGGPHPGEVWLAVSALSFDISLLELLLPLRCGSCVALAADEEARDGERLQALATRHAPRWLQATPSQWRLLVEAGGPGPDGLHALCGGEALPADLARALLSHADALWNVYGPTETTIWSCASPVPHPGAIGIGGPLPGTQLQRLDAGGLPTPDGVVGELCIGGIGLARGYWGRPGLTAERFVPDALGAQPGARLYRTGDRVRRCPDGRLEFLGRGDAQIKLRGHRIELGEIEAQLRAHPAVRDAAVALRAAGTPHAALVAQVVAGEGCAVPELQSWLRARLPAALLPAHWVRAAALPLTSSGKLDRRAVERACAESSPVAGRTDSAAAAPARSESEALLAALWCDVLELDALPPGAEFFECGGNSLLAMRVLARVRRAFGVDLPLRALFERPGLSELARILDALRAGPRPALDAGPLAIGATEAPLSFGQERLWFLHQLEPGSRAYHLAFGVRVRGPLPREIAARALEALATRHSLLRARIRPTPTGARQHFEADGAPPLETVRAVHPSDPARSAKSALRALAGRPFDLEREAPWRAAWLELGADECALLFCFHHIAADGWALEIFARELAEQLAAGLVRRAPALPPLALDYGDYARWQRERAGEALAQRQLEYWRTELAGLPASLELPTDRPRSARRRHGGGSAPFEIPEPLAGELRALARRRDVTLFMLLLASFGLLLQRLSGQRDVAIGTPAAGRPLEALEGILGSFVNTLVLRVRRRGDPRFTAFLEQVRECALGAYANADVPFERVVEALRPERSLAHTPLFQAMLVLRAARPARPGWSPLPGAPGVQLRALAEPGGEAVFDWVLRVEDAASGPLRCELEYNAALLEPPSARALCERWSTLLAAIATRPEARLSELLLLRPDEERVELCAAGVRRRFGVRGTLAQRFAAVARTWPEREAVSCDGAVLSYAELDARAERVAQRLRSLGVGPETRVGLCCGRSLELVIGIVGIARAGGCYVPLDPALPCARLQHIVDDAGVHIALAGRDAWPASLRCERVLELEGAIGQGERDAPTPPAGSAEQLAYVLYTSGSTGRPKGVGIAHAQVLRLFRAAAEEISLRPGDRWTLFHSFGFDFSVWELWGALLHGGCAVVVPERATRDPEAFAELLRAERISVLSQTPSAFAALAPRLCAQPDGALVLRAIVFGGEALDVRGLREWFERYGERGAALYNMYGITETTVHVTLHRVSAAEARGGPPGPGASAIGRPLADLGVRVLDAAQRALPRGAPGELCIAGAGVGRGYPGRPGLTADRFRPDPAGPPGARLYRSGDRGRLRADGTLEHWGRLDDQVQIRGHRVEPAEVRAQLRECEGVAEAHVVFRAKGSGGGELVAYWAAAEGASAPPPSAGRLRAQLAERLPAYMRPARLIRVERIPLTPNGKVDAAALPGPGSEADGSGGHAAGAAGTRLEQLLADLWAAELGCERVGVDESFFDLGGHSLLAVRVMEAVRTRIGGAWPLTALFENPTVASLARWIESRGPATERIALLNAVRAGPSLYCLHPAGGHLEGYRELADALALDGRPVAGIASRSLVDPDWRDGSIAEMADRYAECIERAEAQRDGRASAVHLLGWSLGAVVALAVAVRLEKRGRTVAFLGLVDPPLPGASEARADEGSPAQPLPGRDELERCARRLGVHAEDARLDRLARAERAALDARLRAERDESARLALFLELGRERGWVSAHLSTPVCAWLVDALERARRLVQAHRAECVAADVHLWSAGRGRAPGELERAHTLWSRCTTGSLRAVRLDETHATLIRAPDFIEGLRRALRGGASPERPPILEEPP